MISGAMDGGEEGKKSCEIKSVRERRNGGEERY